jgi:hypothetical protein
LWPKIAMTARPAKRTVASRRSLCEATRSPPGHIFRREGEYWTIVYEGTLFRLRDSKGLRYLAYLLSHPGERVPAAELAVVESGLLEAEGGLVNPRSSATGNLQSAIDERARVAVTKRIKASVTKIGVLHPALAAHLSTRVKTGYFCVYIGDSDEQHAWTLS